MGGVVDTCLAWVLILMGTTPRATFDDLEGLMGPLPTSARVQGTSFINGALGSSLHEVQQPRYPVRCYGYPLITWSSMDRQHDP